MKQALLIIDVQNDYFAGGKSELENPLDALVQIEKVLGQFRRKRLPIIHVQHINLNNDAVFFRQHTEGVLIHEKLQPLEHEHLVIKHAPNSFYQTNLADILAKNKITDLVICGMMSHMCIDTTTRACKDLGVGVTLLDDACATKNLVYQEQIIPAQIVHRTFMASLNGMFANVIYTSDLFIADAENV